MDESLSEIGVLEGPIGGSGKALRVQDFGKGNGPQSSSR